MNKDGLSRTGIRPVLLFPALLVILLLRIIFIGVMGLMPQDTYYFFYSRHLALSYYDHPPMIAYCLRLFTSIFGKEAFVLKLADSVITLLSTLAFYHLAKSFLNGYRIRNALLLFLSTLMVTILSLVSTPDTPLILFWTLSLLMLHRAIFLEKDMYWIWSGICMGLAFDSKYTAIFLPAGVILFLLLSARYRPLLFSYRPWLSLLLFLVVISPVIIWNAENDFASFRFQSTGRVTSMKGVHISPTNFLGVIGHQSAVLLPVLFFALVILLFKVFRKYRLNFSRMSSGQLFLLCFFLPVFIGFFCISLVYWVKLNWMMPAYISGIIWASHYFNRKWIRPQLIISLIVHLALAVEVMFYPVPVKSDDTWVGWRQLSGKVKEIRQQYPDAFIFSMDGYKTSSVLDFYLKDMVYGQNVIGERALEFDFIGTDLDELNGRDALFIDSKPNFKHERKEHTFPPALSTYFDKITELDPILIKKNGRTVRKFLVYICRRYHSVPKPPDD